MTRVISSELLETCLDSSTVKRVTIDEALDEDIMHAVAADGELRYYPHFPRPYFRVDRARRYVVQGILGERSLRVTFSPSANEETERLLVDAIEGK